MFLFNIFKKPLNSESIDSWCKALDDIAKISLLGVPVLLYSGNALIYKIINTFLLLLSSYICLLMADFMRRNKAELIAQNEKEK